MPGLMSLELETANLNPIINQQSFAKMSPTDIANRRESFRKRFIGAIERRANPTSIYNCHGLTFASKRTGIEDTTQIRKILRDDRYRLVDNAEMMAGDVILYLGPKGEIDHSGIVVERNAVPILSIVLSKWGNYTEYLHPIMQCEYYAHENIEFHRVDWV